MPAVVAIRCNPLIRSLYQRLLAKGKLKKVALVACMHKMLTILNSMAKNNTPWKCAIIIVSESGISSSTFLTKGDKLG